MAWMKLTNPKANPARRHEIRKKGVDVVLGSSPHEWQLDAIKEFIDEANLMPHNYNGLFCPPGAGKSTLIKALTTLDIIGTKYSRLQLVAVPKLDIADGFFMRHGKYTTIEIDGNLFHIAVEKKYNFCQESSVGRLISLLTQSRKKIAKLCRANRLGMYAMTSYQALTLAWKRMSHVQRLKAIRNLHLVLDESHHIATELNGIGRIVDFIAKHNDGTTAVTISTATDYRGDGSPTVPENIREKLHTYRRDFIEHFNTLEVSDLVVDVMEYKTNPISQVVKTITRRPKGKHLIVVPSRDTGWRSQFKEDTYWGVDVLIEALVAAGVKRSRILNLVPSDERDGEDGTRAALRREPKRAQDGPSHFDVIITCGLLREGSDWCPCSNLHVTYPEGSLTLAVQTLGRLLRYFEGKTSLAANYYFPEFPEPREGMSKEEILDGRKNCLFLMLQLQEDWFPLLFPVIPAGKKPSEGTGNDGGNTTLRDVLRGDHYERMKREFLTRCIDFDAMGILDESFDGLCDEIIEKYNVPEEYREGAKRTLEALYLRGADTLNFRRYSIDFVREHGFPMLKKDLKTGVLRFKHNSKNMRLLKKIVQRKWDLEFERISKEVQRVGHVNKLCAADRAWLRGWRRQELAAAKAAGV